MRYHSRTSTAALLAAAALTGAALTGCSSAGDPAPTQQLSSRDFATPEAADAQQLRPRRADGSFAAQPAPGVPTIATTGPVAAREGVVDIAVTPGRPALNDDTTPEAIEPPVLMDAKVGDVNGRPVFASRFFADKAARLKRRAADQPREQWLGETAQEIQRALNTIVEAELLTAEALAGLSPAQRVGLRAFLENMRDEQIRLNSGSRTLANRRIAEATDGGDLDEFIRRQEEQVLIANELRRKVTDRVYVPWRDVQITYDKLYDLYNPDPVAHVRLIMVTGGNAEDVAEVQRQLDAGTPFADVASTELNRINRDEGGLGEYQFKDPFETAAVFRIEELNTALHKLSPGEHSAAIPFNEGKNTAWLMLEKIDRISNPLYDVQYGIERTLRSQREAQAKDAYIERLKERASFTSVSVMTERLTRIAESWYYNPIARRR